MRRSPPMKPVTTRTREYCLAAAPSSPPLRSAREWALYVLVLVLLGGAVFLDWRREAIRSEKVAREGLERDASLVSTLLSGKLRVSSAGLDGLRENRFWRQSVAPPSREVNSRLAALADAMDGVRSLLVTDQRGVVIASSRPDLLDTDLSGRECFQALGAGGDGTRHCLSRPFAAPSGRYTFVLSARVLEPSGRFDGTVIVAFEPAWFVQLMRPVQARAEDLRLSLVNLSGGVIHSEPPSGPFNGGAQPVPTSWWPEAKAASTSRSFVAVDGDGRERYVAVVPVHFQDDKPLAVFASRDRATVDAENLRGPFELALTLAAAAAAAALALMLNQGRRRILGEIERRADLERKRADIALSRLIEQQVSMQTISAFAHDLNQPLLAVAAYSEAALNTVRRGVKDPAKLTRMIEGSHTQALRAGALMHQMSAQLSQAIVPGQSAQRFDLNELLTQAAAEMSHHQPGAEPVRFELAPGALWVMGSRSRTNRIIQNLLVNAFQASAAKPKPKPEPEPSGLVTVSSRRVDGFAEVGVRDFGPGVSPKDAERIFSPFFTTKGAGMGLGLSISRALAESQGGKLELGPDTGEGAEFFLTLPLANTHEQDLPR